MRSGGVAFSRGKIGRVVSYASFFAGAMVQGVARAEARAGTHADDTSAHFAFGYFAQEPARLAALHLGNGPVSGHCGGSECSEAPIHRNATDRHLADFSRKRADGIIALGDDMKARLVARGIPEHKILVAENWADG